MFDLEQAILDWSRTIGQGESVLPENIQELETHLRESITSLLEKGLSREEAFLVASARMGNRVALNSEFEKVNGMLTWKRRILWMLCGYVGGGALALAISGVSMCVGALFAMLGFGGAPSATAAICFTFVSWTILLRVVYSKATRSDNFAENGYVSFGWLTALVVIGAVGIGLGVVGNMTHAQMVVADEFSESMLWTSLGHRAIGICLAAASIGLIVALRDRTPRPTTLCSR